MSMFHNGDPLPDGSGHRDSDGQPVANLLEHYRSRRSAWIAEAECLAQLRDQVRSAADQETLEIVSRARRDVRDVIASARRELLVLTEQVRAALGDSEPLPRALESLNQSSWLTPTSGNDTLRDIDATATKVTVDPERSTTARQSLSPDDSRPVDHWAPSLSSLITKTTTTNSDQRGQQPQRDPGVSGQTH